MTTQLRDLTLNEISGVDHPASLVEGWLVKKSDTDPITASLVGALTQSEGPAPVSTLAPTIEAPAVDAPAELDENVAKALEGITKELADARSERDEIRKDRDALNETVAIEKADAAVAAWGHVPAMTAEFSPVLRSLSEEQRTAVTAIFDAVEIAVAAADGLISKELGNESDGEATIESIAKGLVEAGTHSTFATAIAAAADAHPELYNRKDA
jgi:hypothetical protein